MNTKTLYPITVMCELTETQIKSMAEYIEHCLPNSIDDLNDIDEPDFFGSYRLCVYFGTDILNNLIIETAEVQDKNWNPIDADSCVLRQFLRPIIDNYNRGNKAAIRRAKDWEETKKSLQYF